MIIRRSSSWLFAVVLFVTVHAGVASAQDNATVGVSYSYLRLLEGADVDLPVGWLMSFDDPIGRSAISLVGEVAGNYRSEFGETFRLHTFQGGLRLSGRTAPGIDPFAQFLLGGMNSGCCGGSATSFVIEPGVGVDFGMNRGLALRTGISFPIAFDDGDAFTSLRLQAGLVLSITSR